MTIPTEGERAIEAAARIALVWRNPQLRSAMHPWTMASDGQREQATEAAKDIVRAYLAALQNSHKLVPEKPTKRMLADGVQTLIDAGLDGPDGVGWVEAQSCWVNMLHAACEDAPPPGLDSEGES